MLLIANARGVDMKIYATIKIDVDFDLDGATEKEVFHESQSVGLNEAVESALLDDDVAEALVDKLTNYTGFCIHGLSVALPLITIKKEI